MSDFFIKPEWLEAVRGTNFYYPASGRDWSEALAIFGGVVSGFWFCDMYPAGFDCPTSDFQGKYLLQEKTVLGNPRSEIETRTAASGRKFRFLEPSKLSAVYLRDDGHKISITWRRGFGQIGLAEFGERSLGVFMHRGDSPGDGGSNVYFLANKATFYEPCGRLFEKLGRQLTDRALIISDGSNTSIKQLRHFHGTKAGGEEAFEYHQGNEFSFGGFRWSCAGWIGRKYGPTLVWGLTRESPK